MNTIAEQIVDFYNNEINESGEPVTLEWLKRQRIVEGRANLNYQFGHDAVDSTLGEITYLAKAEDMLGRVKLSSKYQLLPQIACFLSWECDTMLDSENPIREKYSSLDSNIPIVFYDSKTSDEELSFLDFQNPIQKQIPINMLNTIYNSCMHTSTNPCLCYFYEYLQKVAYHSLKIAFDEIKVEVEKVIK